MCGIFGIAGAGASFDPGQFGVPSETLELGHRGPDDSGFHLGSNVYLAHRRLSIIDLSSAGRQPIYNEDRSKCVVFNGEIYNFKALRIDLKKRGHKFLTNTRTQ
jgi:asparagine synthase (glutamine-hydrolysing)